MKVLMTNRIARRSLCNLFGKDAYNSRKVSRFMLSRYSRLVTGLLTCSLSATLSAANPMTDEALDCLIEPWVTSEVGSPVQGIVSELLVDRGQKVTKGQALATLESGVEHAEVELAEARALMNSEISAREADLKLAKLDIGRFKDLHSRKVVSSQQIDEATARFRIASAALTQAKENNMLLQLEFQRMKRQFDRRTLRSPVDGVVVSQLTFAGEFIHDNPAMKIAQLDPLRVEVVLPARLFGTIKVGDKASLFPELNASGEPLTSTVDVVDPLLDTRSGTFGVRLKIANVDYQIPAGQRCQIAFDPKISAANPSAPVDTASTATAHPYTH